MIFMQSHQSRRFIGRLNPGDEVLSCLRDACKEKGIRCGEIRATGFLKDIVLEVFDHSQRAYRPVVLGSMTYQLTSFIGNVSILDGQVTVHIHTTLLPDLASGDTTLVGGRLSQATVVGLEFTLDSFDDFTLVRRHDEETGFEQWVELEFAPGTAPVSDTDGRSDSATVEEKADEEEEEEEADEENIELSPGDILDHPRLNLCEVVSYDGDRAVIRMESGRTAELHLSVIKLTFRETRSDGSRVFQVEMLRR